MLVKEIVKLRNTIEIKKLKKDSREIDKLLEQRKENYSEIFELFPKIFTKLHPRRKVLDIPLSPEKSSEDKLTLHTFGFYVLNHYYKRSKPITHEELLEFLRLNNMETIHKVADQIPYEDKRTLFRQFCQMVKVFLDDHEINDIEPQRKEIKTNTKCNKKIQLPNGKTHTIRNIELKEGYYGDEHIEIHLLNGRNEQVSEELNISDIYESVEGLLIYEQLKAEIINSIKQFKKVAELNTKDIKSEFLKELKDKFATYLVAEQL